MNGIVSMHQRRQGLDYKINFGVEIPRLKSIAQEYAQDKELATTLWNDNIRECKLLAIFLLPQENYAEVAERWIAETPFTEIADHLAMNILCKLPDAATQALQWAGNPAGLHRYCGYLTLAHVARRGQALTAEQEKLFVERAGELFEASEGCVDKQCAAKAVCSYIDNSGEGVERLLALCAPHRALAAFVNDYIQEI